MPNASVKKFTPSSRVNDITPSSRSQFSNVLQVVTVSSGTSGTPIGLLLVLTYAVITTTTTTGLPGGVGPWSRITNTQIHNRNNSLIPTVRTI